MNDIQIYLGHDGNAMKNNTSFYFANYFDWIFMKDKVIKKNEHPNSCYIKTDYLQKYINDILNIKNDFILISGCSDFSPQIKYSEQYLSNFSACKRLKFFHQFIIIFIAFFLTSILSFFRFLLPQ